MDGTISGVVLAVEKAGSQLQFAKDHGVTQQAVSAWVRRGFVPLRRARAIGDTYGIDWKLLVDPRVLELVSAA